MKQDQADAEKLLTWLREPDYEDEFSLAQAIDWMNRRPIAEAMRLLAISQITKGIAMLGGMSTTRTVNPPLPNGQ